MLTVILVEDEDMIRRGLLSAVHWEVMGARVVGDAANGEEGLALMRELRPDIVFTDIKMPRMDGIEMAKRAREEGILKHLVFLSSYGEFRYAQEAVRLSAVDYLLKPVDETEIARLIARFQEGGKEEWENPYVERAVQAIKTQFAARISMEQLAEASGVSASYLSRKFKEATGMTFGEALAKERLRHATEELRSGLYKVYEVAERNGFGDYKNFVAVFKKYLGSAPTEYHKKR